MGGVTGSMLGEASHCDKRTVFQHGRMRPFGHIACRFTDCTRSKAVSYLLLLVCNIRERIMAGFSWWGPGANIEDGPSLIIHWSSGSQDQRTVLINTTFIWWGPTGGGPGAMTPWGLDPLNLALERIHSVPDW